MEASMWAHLLGPSSFLLLSHVHFSLGFDRTQLIQSRFQPPGQSEASEAIG